MILEMVVGTIDASGATHLAPMGVQEDDGLVLLQPFRPSRTLDNLEATGQAVLNATDDVRVIAGCLTGRRTWPLMPSVTLPVARLASALAHREVVVARTEPDPLRPRFWMRVVHEVMHAPFRGLCRARAAVVEAAILVSRLDRLPAEKVDAEMAYLRIAVDRTAGPEEREAFGWLVERIAAHRAGAEA